MQLHLESDRQSIGNYLLRQLLSGLESAATNALGLAVRELPPEGRKALGVDYGLMVEGITGETAARSPLQPGDVIVAVGQERFRSLEEFNKLIGQRKKGESVPLLVRRGEGALYVPLEVA